MADLIGQDDMRKRSPNWLAFNEHYFDSVDSQEKAYWLGFITADGCVRRGSGLYQLVVKLKESDAGHLEKLCAALDGQRRIRFSPRSGVAGPTARVAFSSPQLVESLARLGVGPRKSTTVEPWNGPADLMPHYWRGLFDGDGSIGRDRGHAGQNWQVTLCGSRACVDAFAAWGRDLCGSNSQVHFRSNIWYWPVRGVAMPQALIRELYRDATIYLDRKFSLAQQLLGQPIRARSWRGQECSREGCDAEAEVMGRCKNHYRADQMAQAPGAACSIDSCAEKQIAHGYCRKHWQRFHKHGDPLQVNRGREGARRFSLDDSFFDEINTEDKAYWLGFVAACGSVIRSNKTFQVRLEVRILGEGHLARLRDVLGSGKSLRYRTGARLGDLAGVTFDSWRLVDALERQGVTTRDGMTVTPWDGPLDLMPHYWRGIADGSAWSPRPRNIM